MANLSKFKKRLMLDEITFYSICEDTDRQKILDKAEMTFDDFRRLCLLTDYLELKALHKFIWDMHAYKFIDDIEAVYQKCKNKDEHIPDMLLETGRWLDNFWKNAPNDTVAYLLHEIFSSGLSQKKAESFDEFQDCD